MSPKHAASVRSLRAVLDRRAVLAGLAAVPLAAACDGGRGANGGHHPATPESVRYVAAHRPRADGSPDAGALAASAVARFTADLYGGLATEPGNLVCSPYSVVAALAMARAGAVGDTARELDDALRIAPTYSAWAAGLNWLDQQLGTRSRTVTVGDHHEQVSLRTANSLWAQRGRRWHQDFLDALATDFGAGLHVVDFLAQPEPARRAINAWTAERTHDRITDLLPPGVVDRLTRLVLVNAIWLKAPWAEPFDPSLTRDATFHRRDRSTVTTPMMVAQVDSASYAEGRGWAAVSLPYAGDGLAMTVVVPDFGSERHPAGAEPSIEAVERAIAGEGLARLLAGLRPAAVAVQLPRWRTRTAVSLTPTLQALGIHAAFDPRAADFSAMTDDDRLHVSAVQHQAFVAVDEAGTEAAAATAAVVGVTSTRTQVRTVRADHPFVYVIHDVATRTPLFVGRVEDPTG